MTFIDIALFQNMSYSPAFYHFQERNLSPKYHPTIIFSHSEVMGDPPSTMVAPSRSPSLAPSPSSRARTQHGPGRVFLGVYDVC
jgi:hypothetical protein